MMRESADPKVGIVEDLYAALNGNDIPRVLRSFAEEIERVEPAAEPGAGTFRGLKAVREHFQRARNTWVEGACNLEEIKVNGDKVVALVHVKVRVKDRLDWAEGKIADGYVFRDEKVVQMITFLERAEALAWAGI